jgi:sulfatase modifying factor 1
MTLARKNLWFAGLAVVMAAGFFSGCSDDNGPTDPTKATGTVTIAPQPDGIDAPWQLAGPGGIDSTGSGRTELKEMPAGTYTVTWHEVSKWETPDESTGTLASGGSVTFAGAYEEEDFVLIPAGTFTMGSPTDEPERNDEETQHQVTLTRGFYMSKYEVTEQWWYEVMGGAPTTSQLPKNYVDWDMAVEFCNALSIKEGLTPAYTINGPNGDVTWNRSANGYRLPTEAEWEYACRATTTMAFNNNTNCLSSDTEANFYGSDYQLPGCPTGVYRGARTTVGTFPSNDWDLYDMHGNLWEWVWDGYRSDYENLGSVDPVYDVGPGAYRVIRGGCWLIRAQSCRSAYRYYDFPVSSFSDFGLRPVRSAF